jgi:hypothetical protein
VLLQGEEHEDRGDGRQECARGEQVRVGEELALEVVER